MQGYLDNGYTSKVSQINSFPHKKRCLIAKLTQHLYIYFHQSLAYVLISPITFPFVLLFVRKSIHGWRSEVYKYNALQMIKGGNANQTVDDSCSIIVSQPAEERCYWQQSEITSATKLPPCKCFSGTSYRHLLPLQLFLCVSSNQPHQLLWDEVIKYSCERDSPKVFSRSRRQRRKRPNMVLNVDNK